MQRHVERVVEPDVLAVDEVELSLDALLEDGPGQRLVDGKGVGVPTELPDTLAPT